MAEIRHWTEVADDPRLVIVGGREFLGQPGRCQAASFGQGSYSLDFAVNYDGRISEGTQIKWWDHPTCRHGSLTGKLWRCCGNQSRGDSEFCTLHAGMMDGYLLGDPGRKAIGLRRALRAKLNEDRMERGTPAHFYWRERFEVVA